VNLIKTWLLVALAGALLFPPALSAEIVDRIVAVVNGEAITLSEWDAAFESVKERIDKGYQGQNKEQIMAEARQATLERLINSKLMELESRKAGLTVKDEEINAAIRDMVAQKKVSLEELNRSLAQQGVTLAQYKEGMKETMTRQRLIRREIGSKITITDEEIGSYYEAHRQEYEGTEAVRVRLIFLPLPKGADDAARQRVRDEVGSLLDRIRNGEPFEAMAYRFTKGPAAEQGGDIGFVERGSLAPEVDREVFRLKPGEVSGVIEAAGGLYLLKVVDQRGAGLKPLAAVRDEIRSRIEEEKMNRKFEEWITDLRKGALIEIK